MSSEITAAQVGKAFSHPLRGQILEYLLDNEQASPADLSRALDEPIGNVSYHVRFLLDAPAMIDGPDGTRVPGPCRGWKVVELVGTRQRRGAIEHFYRLRPEWKPVVARQLGRETDGVLDRLRLLTADLGIVKVNGSGKVETLDTSDYERLIATCR